MSRFSLQTVERDSLFTRLDFRAKLVLAGVITLIAFVWESPLLGGLLMVGVILASLLAGVRVAYLRRILTLLLPFYVLLLLTQGFFAADLIRARTGQTTLTPLFSFPDAWILIGGATMTVEGVLYGLNIVFKTLTMILVIPLVIFTTDANTMVVGMVKVGVPYRIAFVFSSTLRFFPLLFDEVQAIIQAQRLRGLAFEKMSFFRRVAVYARVAVPLILGAIVKAQRIEVILQAKAFTGSSERTYLHETRFTPTDTVVVVGALLFLVAAGVAYFAFGIGRFGGPV